MSGQTVSHCTWENHTQDKVHLLEMAFYLSKEGKGNFYSEIIWLFQKEAGAYLWEEGL